MEQSKELRSYKGILDFAKEHNKLMIPICQREYEWKKSNIEDFIEDLVNDYKCSNADSSYTPSIGMIYTYFKNESEKECWLYDGQQRITTLLLLAKCLGIYEQIGLKLIADLESYNNEVINVFEDGEYNPKSALGTALNTIQSCIAKFKDELGEDSNFISSFTYFILNNLYFYEFRCFNEMVAINTFLKLNNRGLELNFLDLVKSYLKQNQASLNFSNGSLKTKDIMNFAEKVFAEKDEHKGVLIDSYTGLIKCYTSPTIPKKEKEKFTLITDYIKEPRNLDIFFDEWFVYSKIWFIFTYNGEALDNGITIETEDSEFFDKAKKTFYRMTKLKYKEFLPLVVLVATFYEKKHISEKVAKDFLNKLTLKFLYHVTDHECVKAVQGTSVKFNSNELEYETVFKAIHDEKTKFQRNPININSNFKWLKEPKIKTIEDNLEELSMYVEENQKLVKTIADIELLIKWLAL